ncbi:unnamed protein product [Polarella glacialis]|uniref:histidinol-phosphatase n=2 Tax=Polarella glacialis TaxID=89957 RepID=A0A813EJV5_POLGL|nr:unnamed protein product [Polarella glacialis]
MEAFDVSPSLVSFAEDLANAAGTVIRGYWRVPIEVESKDEPGRPVAESPVTVADREAEAVMRKMIESAYPSHGIYGEEFGNVRLDAEYVWVLDPIDGTKSFITGKPLFGTLIALLHRGKPVMGVIDQCVLKERWVGANGCTRLNGKAVRCKGVAGLKDAMLYATTPHMFAPGLEEDRFGRLRDRVKRPLYGCDCYAYALCASGFVDLVVEADLGVYDYCALVPVVTFAGGMMTDWEGKDLTLQSHSVSKGRVVAAANQELWKAAVDVLSGRSGGPNLGPFAVFQGLSLPSFVLGAAAGAALVSWLSSRRP